MRIVAKVIHGTVLHNFNPIVLETSVGTTNVNTLRAKDCPRQTQSHTFNAKGKDGLVHDVGRIGPTVWVTSIGIGKDGKILRMPNDG